MANQANRMMIGGSVVLALFILATSLAVFGFGKFFKKTNKYVLYFDESIKGLSMSAPVLFQGVPVGSVTSIVIRADLLKVKAHIPVIIEIEPDRLQVGEDKKTPRNPREVANKLIEAGLRATLEMQSLITGQVLIALDFFPGTPVVMKNIDKDDIEIPTIPSTTAKLGRTLEKLDLEALQKKLESGLDGLDKLVNNPGLTANLRDLKEKLQSAHKLITRMDRYVDPLTKDMTKTFQDFSRLANDVDSRVKELTIGLDETLSGFDKTLSGLDKTMSKVRGVISQDAPLVVDLESKLKELSTMSRSIRELADYLEQHPASLIRSKKKPGGQ
jgi:paraquat-inducible protein B